MMPTTESSANWTLEGVVYSRQLLMQDVLGRMLDSVIGFARPNFFEKTADNADL